MTKSNRGSSRATFGPDIHGEPMFGEGQYVVNAADVGSMGRGMATSGLSVDGNYVEVSAGLDYRKTVAVYNDGADTVFLGPSGNGIANMYPVAGSGGQIAFNVTSGITMYAVTDGTTTNIRVMEIG